MHIFSPKPNSKMLLYMVSKMATQFIIVTAPQPKHEYLMLLSQSMHKVKLYH